MVTALEKSRKRKSNKKNYDLFDQKQSLPSVSEDDGLSPIFLDNVHIVNVGSRIAELKAKIEKASVDLVKLNMREKMIRQSSNEDNFESKIVDPGINQLNQRLSPLFRLWHILLQFNEVFPKWMDGPFDQVEPDRMLEIESDWREVLTTVRLEESLMEQDGPREVADFL